MSRYFNLFSSDNEYESKVDSLLLPNVSFVDSSKTLHYLNDTRAVAIFNVKNTSAPTKILDAEKEFTKVEIDGVEQQNIGTGYTFSNVGLHTVRYMFTSGSTVPEEAFLGCVDMQKMTLLEGVKVIGNRAFSGCTGLQEIILPNNIVSIYNSAFEGCTSLVEVNLKTTQGIGTNVFKNCTSLKTVGGNQLVNVNSGAFSGCTSLVTAILERTVIVKSDTFFGCQSLKNVTFLFATTIERDAFVNCNSLTSITIPSGVNTMYGGAFNMCENLALAIMEPSKAPTIPNYPEGGDVFNGCSGDFKLLVHTDAEESYINTTGWGGVYNIDVILST